MNSVILCGRIGSMNNYDTVSQTITKFSVATQDGKKKNDNTREGNFSPCIAFGSSATFLRKYFHVGMWIGLQGHLLTQRYQDKTTGEIKYSTEVIAERIHFIGPKETENNNVDDVSIMDFTNVDEKELPFSQPTSA